MKDIIGGLEERIRGRQIKLLIGATRKRLQRFRDLESLDQETKNRIRSTVYHYEVQIAFGKHISRRTQDALIVPYVLACVLVIFGAPWWIVELLNYDLGSFEVGTAFMVNIFTTTVFMYLVLLVPTRLMPATFRIVWLVTILSLCTAILLGLVYPLSSRSPDLRVFILMSLLFGQVGWLGILLVALIIRRSLGLVFRRAQSSSNPDAVVVDGLIQILADLESKPQQWAYASFRRELILGLETIAKCVERDMYKQLKSSDPATDAWLEGVTRQIAAAFRVKKKWLLTPKPDTRLELIESISKSLVALANADWDTMEKVEPMEIPVRWLWSQRIGELLRTVAVGGLPLVVLWGVQQSSLALSDPVCDYAVIGGTLWALFTVVAAFDPSLRVRISILKEVVDLLPFAGKKT